MKPYIKYKVTKNEMIHGTKIPCIILRLGYKKAKPLASLLT